MGNKSEFVQIRVTPLEKAELKRRARDAGQDLSRFVMSRALPPADERFSAIVRTLAEETSPAYALAELNDFLSQLAPVEFRSAVANVSLDTLTALLQSYVAAMVEVAAARKGQAPPPWTASIEGLDEPHFATGLKGLRLHLLQSAPVPFKRRNLFVDATVGHRV